MRKKTSRQLGAEIAAYLAKPSGSAATRSSAKTTKKRAKTAKTAKSSTRNERVRSVLRNRRELCSDGCPGWVPGDNGIERCDECASLNGYANKVHDDDLRVLPEVRQAARRFYEASDE